MSVDVVVVGAGIVGAACAYYAACDGLSVCVIDRGALAGGTTSAGEGNLLVSDKKPGPELDLAVLGSKAWRELGETPLRGRSVAEHIELEPKGGLVVASSEQTLGSLDALVDDQRQVGVQAAAVPADELLGLEPNLAHGLAGGYLYPQDMQVQPMLAAATLLRLARDAGADLLLGDAVAGFLRLGERVVGVRTAKRDVPAGAVVNAAGPWAGTVAALAGVYVPVAPRRGFILVTAATSRAAQGLLRRIRRRRRERLRCPAVLAGR